MARYSVMTLLYRGKISEAEEALNQLVAQGAIDPNTEARYRALLQQAFQFEAQAKAKSAADDNPAPSKA